MMIEELNHMLKIFSLLITFKEETNGLIFALQEILRENNHSNNNQW